MRGQRYVHSEADGPTHPTIAESLAREGAVLAVPATPGEDVAYDDALSGRTTP
jgi:hypothetical protein